MDALRFASLLTSMLWLVSGVVALIRSSWLGGNIKRTPTAKLIERLGLEALGWLLIVIGLMQLAAGAEASAQLILMLLISLICCAWQINEARRDLKGPRS